MSRLRRWFLSDVPVWLTIIGLLVTGAVVSGGWLLTVGGELKVLSRLEPALDMLQRHEVEIAVLRARLDARTSRAELPRPETTNFLLVGDRL